jgi:hypothetical protein
MDVEVVLAFVQHAVLHHAHALGVARDVGLSA